MRELLFEHLFYHLFEHTNVHPYFVVQTSIFSAESAFVLWSNLCYMHIFMQFAYLLYSFFVVNVHSNKMKRII